LKPECIHKILIANRSEIALRIKRAASSLNIPTVAIFSDRESGSSWVRQFQEAYSLGNGQLSNTWLNIDHIIELAKKSGADAIHPGYGFLSENHLFARACEENQIQFIGPSSDIIKLMGDKITAHHFVSGLGIPVIDKIIDTPHEISKLRHTIEYPVLVKAVAGGGGKGMRLVKTHTELTDVLEITASEAYQYFADDRVYVEKYLHAPRHIEVQIMGDTHGNLVHLFERECSIQRRHQKIIEEAPAATLTEKVRKKIIDAALTIAGSVNYINAGTIEFLLDDTGDFFFLEMNTRIQVEHGITEMITGIDLVKEQILVAQGFPLSFSQKDVPCKGHAIESRIYAEDPEHDLLPSPGKIHYYSEPSVKNVRMESAVTSGTEIAADFDPLIAKVIAHGESREDAISKMENALEKTVITGVHHNIPLISAILADEGYRRNEVSTTYLQDRYELFKVLISTRKKKTGISELILTGTIISLFAPKSRQSSTWKSLGYWRITPRIGFKYMKVKYTAEYRITGTDSAEIWYDSEKYIIKGIRFEDNKVSYHRDDSNTQFYFVPETDGAIVVTNEGLDFELRRTDRLEGSDFTLFEEENAVEQELLRSPLPGKVNRIFVKMNEKVNKGDHLITIESMKLENGILAPHAGTVQQVLTSEGAQVRQNEPLIFIKPLHKRTD
jgi:3-methylcrotonyl-CoA carboxylase alpha subunit